MVYCVVGHVAHEGDDLLGVFNDLEKARKLAEAEYDGGKYYASVCVQEWNPEDGTYAKHPVDCSFPPYLF